MSSERSERVVHPSFVTPMFAATDKENEYHAGHNMASYPMTPGNKPQKKGKAMTTTSKEQDEQDDDVAPQ